MKNFLRLTLIGSMTLFTLTIPVESKASPECPTSGVWPCVSSVIDGGGGNGGGNGGRKGFYMLSRTR